MIQLALVADKQQLDAYALAAPRLHHAVFSGLVGPQNQGASQLAQTARAPSVQELLAQHDRQIDAVVVDAASADTWAVVQQAAAAGKHVLVEPSMGPTLERIESAIDTCGRHDKTFMLGRRLRFLPGVQVIKNSLDEGKLGQPGLLRIHDWISGSDGRISQGRMQATIDLAIWLFGQSPEATHAVSRSGSSGSTPKFVQMHFGFGGDGMALIDIAPTYGDDDYFSVSLIGSTGAAYADDHHNMQLVFREGHSKAIRTRQDGLSLFAQLQAFVDSIREQRPPPITHEETLAAVQVASQVEAALCETASKGEASRSTTTIPLQKTPQSAKTFQTAVLSVVKHDYVPRGVASHPRFELKVVADDEDQPDWVHQRNEKFAAEYGIAYIRGVDRALSQFDLDVAVISSEAERHCDLSVRAAQAGLHIVQDKPMSNCLSECDRVVEAVQKNGIQFLMWNRNFLPAVLHASQIVQRGEIGQPLAIHVDFYFSKDAGPPKGSRKPGEPPLNWLEAQKAAHVDGSDGGVGVDPMGELKIEGIYPLAYIRMLTGAEVRRVFARTASHFHQLHADNNVEDLATVTLEMEGGMVGSLCIGRIGAASHPDIGEIKIHLVGTEGSAVISEARPEAAVYYRGQKPSEYPQRRLAIDNDYCLMENFAQAIDDGGDSILGAAASRAIAAVVQAALESGRTGKVVDVG